MHRVTPEVYLVGESMLDEREIERYLRETYAEVGTDWFDKNIDAPDRPSDAELLTELMGRLCYRSFGVGEHNKNITKIREGNFSYIENILKSKHGSVTEHGTTHWIFRDVSRVFTHELVRHRTGLSPSQESLRYVRMDDFGLWLPEDEQLSPDIVALCEAKFKSDEKFCQDLSWRLGLHDEKRDFNYKKKWTSFIRRFAPQGIATTIGITINFRSMRHVIAMRTAESAEVEIREVFDKLATIAVGRWPALLQDFGRNAKGEWVPQHAKI